MTTMEKLIVTSLLSLSLVAGGCVGLVITTVLG